MKHGSTSKSFPVKPEQVAAAVARAPERVADPDCSYDPSDPTAVEAFWKNATVRRPDQRGRRNFPLPSHAFAPAVGRDDPDYQGVIEVLTHESPEERQLLNGLLAMMDGTIEHVELRRTSIRDNGLYLILNVGVGIAANILTDFIRHAARLVRGLDKRRGNPVIYISPAYAPKKVFRLPEEEAEVLEYFRRFPSKLSSEERA